MSERHPAVVRSGPDGHQTRQAVAPGRVNLMGDHTDYNGGLALPMAIDLATQVSFTEDDSDHVLLVSDHETHPVEIAVDLAFDRSTLQAIAPAWGRLAAAVTAQVRPRRGGVARIRSNLPVGSGLSSSAAFSVGLALALGVELDPVAMARLCQRAEAAVGSDVGLMDPITSAAGLAGHALVIDFTDLSIQPITVPDDVEIFVVHSGQSRPLNLTAYASRRAECDAAALEIGHPLGQAEMADVPGFQDSLTRRRVRHVISESARVTQLAEALNDDDLDRAGQIMKESHTSLAVDFESSSPTVDALVQRLDEMPGVFGARVTGGGFGGCVVALAEPGALDRTMFATPAWAVTASDGATVAVSQGN